MKDFQATEEASNPPKRTFNISKHKISSFFVFFLIIFACLDPDPNPETQLNPDPDPETQLNPDPNRIRI
jgi:hypothetical protein